MSKKLKTTKSERKPRKKVAEITVEPVVTEYTVTNKNIILILRIDKNHIEIQGKDKDEFVFRSTNKPETLNRWEDVLDTLMSAVQAAKEIRKEIK